METGTHTKNDRLPPGFVRGTGAEYRKNARMENRMEPAFPAREQESSWNRVSLESNRPAQEPCSLFENGFQ